MMDSPIQPQSKTKEKEHLPQLTAISVAAENASGNVAETNREGATAIVIAITFTLFLPHQLPCPYAHVHQAII